VSVECRHQELRAALESGTQTGEELAVGLGEPEKGQARFEVPLSPHLAFPIRFP
jgi:hypothetical protein